MPGETSDINHVYTEEMVCPWCGYKNTEPCEFFQFNPSYTETSCEECEKTYSAHVEYTAHYSTYKKLEVGAT